MHPYVSNAIFYLIYHAFFVPNVLLDINECSLKMDACSTAATCHNTHGSYTCLCKWGYSGDGFNCTDIQECESNSHQCHDNATCENTAGSYTCKCDAGFLGNGTQCQDVDECTRGLTNCSSHSLCTNTVGSYRCACLTGYSGDGLNCTGELFTFLTSIEKRKMDLVVFFEIL